MNEFDNALKWVLANQQTIWIFTLLICGIIFAFGGDLLTALSPACFVLGLTIVCALVIGDKTRSIERLDYLIKLRDTCDQIGFKEARGFWESTQAGFSCPGAEGSASMEVWVSIPEIGRRVLAAKDARESDK